MRSISISQPCLAHWPTDSDPDMRTQLLGHVLKIQKPPMIFHVCLYIADGQRNFIIEDALMVKQTLEKKQ